MEIRVIVNPQAGAGSASRKISTLSRELHRVGLRHEIVETRGPGDATDLTRRAREDGVETIAIVGGDGTLNEVAQAFLGEDGGAVEGPALALIPAGTGGDFRRTFAMTRRVEDAVERLRRAEPRPLDLGVLELTGDDGRLVRKAFLNITSFGISGRIDHIVNSGPKWMGGRAAFFVATLRAMSVYRNAPVAVHVDDRPFTDGPIVNVAIANGRYFGGGMMIAPDADPGDGLFDVVALGDLSRLESIGLTGKIYSGTHLEARGITSTRGRVVRAEPLREDPVLVDMDGETPGRLPLTARVLPAALRLYA